MRSDRPQARFLAEQDLDGVRRTSEGAAHMTSRGTRYWSSGSIPLIAPDVLGEIIATAADIAIVISEQGEILSVIVNPEHPGFGNLDGWQGRDVRETLTSESQEKIDTHLARFVGGEAAPRGIELNHEGNERLSFPISYSLHAIGPDGAILMLGRDMRPVAEMQQQLVRAQMALERDYEALREYDTRFRVIMEASRDAMIFVNQASGKIIEANGVAAALLSVSTEDLVGAQFAGEFDASRRGDPVAALATQATSESTAPVTLTAKHSRRQLHVHPTAFRAAGERMILCRLADASDTTRVPDDALSENLAGLYQEGSDAIVFTDQEGVVLASNEAFLNLVDAAHSSAVRKKSLGTFLARGAVDLRVLLDNARRVGQMRMYATKLASEYGSQIAVEISATWLNDRPDPVAVFVIRDASRADAVRRTGVTATDDGVKSVMELVGSATLKEIVAETTDVIEKMCIETAVELTNNNRVAAAEMLGLSRQSLYVKLRKFDLLSRDPS